MTGNALQCVPTQLRHEGDDQPARLRRPHHALAALCEEMGSFVDALGGSKACTHVAWLVGRRRGRAGRKKGGEQRRV